MAARFAWRCSSAALLACSAVSWQVARADAPALARVGSLSIDLETFSRRALRLAPFQRARFGESWPEQRRRFLEQELVRDALLEAEAAHTDRGLSSPRDTALAQALLMDLEQQVEAAGVPAEQIASYYAQHRQSYEAPRSILIWRILLRQETQARELLRELGAPNEGTWGRLARERSIDTATYMRSGSLGYVAADGQSHIPQVRVASALFAAADQVRDGEVVPRPVNEGDAFAIVWRRASRPSQPNQLSAASADIAALLSGERFASESRALLERLRRDGVREYQPARLAGFEPRPIDVLQPAPLAPPKPLESRSVTLTPRASDLGLR
jgi:peptidyl-prolyl cis-trans isomerase C